MITKEQIPLVVDLVYDILKEDPIDFGSLEIDETTLIPLIANKTVDNFITAQKSLDADMLNVLLLSSVAKLIIENFVLNYKLIRKIYDP